MKSTVIATLSVAAMASAHEVEARSPDGVTLSSPGFGYLQTYDCGGVSIRMPDSLAVDTNGCPSQGPGPVQPPPKGCVDVWHPAHHGIVIDDCSDWQANDWHYVVPCNGSCTQASTQHQWGTTVSTIYQTHVATVTACASTVTDCPARSTPVTTVIVQETTSICPVPIVSATSTSTSAVTYVVPSTATATVTVAPASTKPYVAPQPVETEECDEEEDDDVDAASVYPAAKPSSYNAPADNKSAPKSAPKNSPTYNAPASNGGYPAGNNSRSGSSCTPGTYGCPRPSNSTVPAVTAGGSTNAQMAGAAAMGFVVAFFL